MEWVGWVSDFDQTLSWQRSINDLVTQEWTHEFGEHMVLFINNDDNWAITHWRLGDVATILKAWFSNFFHRTVAWAFAVRGMPQNLTYEKLTLDQVKALCCQATSHYPSWCRSRSLSPNDITRPQWVKQSGAWTNSDSVLPECISQPSYFLSSIVVFTRNAHETIDAYIHQWTRSPQVCRLAYHIIPSIP